MTDIEESSRIRERDPKAARQALALRDAISEGDVERNRGMVVMKLETLVTGLLA